MVDRANNIPVNGTQNKFKNDEGRSPDNDFQKMLLGDEGYKVDAFPPYSEANPHVEYSNGNGTTGSSSAQDEGYRVDAFPPYSEDKPHVEYFGS